jgi:uncharacterized YigZ family protein
MPDIIDVYKTIAVPSKGIFKDKGSKFLSFAYPITSENEVKQFIEVLKKEYFDARHHCFAYAIGINRLQYRTFDDGEPSGTAGKPIYNQILSANLTNILIVVVRYFGGTLLGTSGLINAYKAATIDALHNAKIIEKTDNEQIMLKFDYLLLNDVLKILRIDGITIIKQIFDNICNIEIEARKTMVNRILAQLAKLKEVEIER